MPKRPNQSNNTKTSCKRQKTTDSTPIDKKSANFKFLFKPLECIQDELVTIQDSLDHVLTLVEQAIGGDTDVDTEEEQEEQQEA